MPQQLAVQERPPTRLAMRVGGKKRWGPREDDVGDIPRGIGFSSKAPGGFADLTSKLGRQVFAEYGDLNPFDDIVVYGPGIATAWEGRMQAFPRESASRTIEPSAVGYSAHLRDDPSVSEIYVWRDLTAWQPPSTERQIQMRLANQRGDWSAEVGFDQGNNAAVIQKLARLDAVSGARTSVGEVWFDAHRIPLSSVYYGLETFDPGAGGPSGQTLQPSNAWHCRISGCSSDQVADQVQSSDLNPNSSGYPLSLDSGGIERTFVILSTYYDGTATADSDWQAQWRKLAVYGDHGVPLQYTRDQDGNPTAPYGFYGHDLLADLISRWAPLLTFTIGETILEDTSFVVPHFAPGYDGPQTVEDAVLALNAFFLNDFYVWDDRTFWWLPQTYQSRTWNARLSEGAELKLEGPQADTLINGALAHFTDFAGSRRSVGPPNSRADQTDASLEDTSSDNPVNAAGIPRRWGRLDISQQTDYAGAIQVAQRFLELSSRSNQQGQMQVVRDCEDSNGRRWPAWMIRAGDYIRLQDGDQTLRKVIQASYEHDSERVSLDLDVPSFRLDALLERMGVALVGHLV